MLDGNPHYFSQVSVGAQNTRFCSVLMRAPNTLSRAETELLLNVAVVTARFLGRVVMS
jgi:hypothetical protein